MWYLIVTARSLIWMLLSLIADLIMISAFLSPSWLVAAPEKLNFDNETIVYQPSVGVYAKCSKPLNFYYPVCTLIAVEGLATDSDIFPTLWKIAVVFLGIGMFVISSESTLQSKIY